MMELTVAQTLVISALFLVIAFLYSSVGHGGASGYLAVLSFFVIAPAEMSSTSLLLNIVVAGIAFVTYVRAGHFSFRLTVPFLLASIPLAFVGGLLKVSPGVYMILLAVALIIAAFRLILHIDSAGPREVPGPPPAAIALPAGGAIGLLSGIVGIGGGIFLSPLMLLMRWADPKRTSATSACFILVNSFAGIAARHLEGTFSVGRFLPFAATAIIGGFLGSRFGALKFSNLMLRRLLAVVLLIAAVKLLWTSL